MGSEKISVESIHSSFASLKSGVSSLTSAEELSSRHLKLIELRVQAKTELESLRSSSKIEDHKADIDTLTQILNELNVLNSYIEVKLDHARSKTPDTASNIELEVPASGGQSGAAGAGQAKKASVSAPVVVSVQATEEEEASNPLLTESRKAAQSDPALAEWSTWGVLEIDPQEVSFDEKDDFLGKGTFGKVYRGRCRGKEVAVKVPVKQHLSVKELNAFRREVLMMSKIFHPNVVLFMGASTSPGHFLMLTELMNTDLERLLHSDKPLSLNDRLKMAKDTALGVNWLHGISNIIHRDLKPANILVGDSLVVKITDFGFAALRPSTDEKLADEKGGAKGTPLWMAPEIMMGKPFTETVDVYAFGIILWQMITRIDPFAHHRSLKKFRISVCKRNERPEIPADTHPAFASLIKDCWDGDPNKRPPFKEIVTRLDEVLLLSILPNESSANFWRSHWLDPHQELKSVVNWRDFFTAVCLSVFDQKPSLDGGDHDAIECNNTAGDDDPDADISSLTSSTLTINSSTEDDDVGSGVGERVHPGSSSALAKRGAPAFLTDKECQTFFRELICSHQKSKQSVGSESDKVTLDQFARSIIWFGNYFEAKEGQLVFRELLDLKGQAWFHGDITKEEADSRLSCRPEGTFLVRLSATTPGWPFTISMINNQHRRVHHQAPGEPYTPKGASRSYASIPDIIKECKELNLLYACPKSTVGWGYNI